MPKPIRNPHMTNILLRPIDGRTKEAKIIGATRAAMVAHVGGKPDAAQAVIIERICGLTLRLAMMDRKAASGGGMTDIDSRNYLGWTNTLTRSVMLLGKPPAPAPAPVLATAPRPLSLAEHRAGRTTPPATATRIGTLT